jgi:undecaprenyl-diphosphatase
MASVGVTATVVNLALKPVTQRGRPDRAGLFAIDRPGVKMPASRSFPSGHTAAAYAFATGVGRELPWARVPLYVLAALVGYSRVQTGVHYPLDVAVGAVCGIALAELTNVWIDRAGDREQLVGADAVS